MKRILISLFALGMGLSAAAQNSAIYKADAAMEKQDFGKAIEILKECLANPKTTKIAEAQRKLGQCNAMFFNDELRKAAQGLPFDTTLFCNSLDNTVEAFTASHIADTAPDAKGKVKPQFEMLNKLNIQQMLNYYNYAGIFQNMAGNTEKSLEYFEKYINMPKNPVFTQQETDSIYAANSADYAQAAYNVSLLNYNMKNWDAVIRNADVALQDPNNENAHDLHVMKTNALLMKGDTVAYVDALKEAVAQTGGGGFLNDLVNYYMRSHDREGAIKMADELIAKNPSEPKTYYIKGVFEMNMTPYNYAAARDNFAKALEMNPDYLEANTNMGVCYVQEISDKLNKGEVKLPTRVDDAASSKQYQKIMQEQVYPYYNKAIPYFEKARALSPDEPQYWAEGLHRCYYNLKMFEKDNEIKPYLSGN